MLPPTDLARQDQMLSHVRAGVTEVSEWNRVCEALERLPLEHTQRSPITQVLSAHDLQNPLNTIMMSGLTLQRLMAGTLRLGSAESLYSKVIESTQTLPVQAPETGM